MIWFPSCFTFTTKPFQPKAGLPRGGGVKKNTLPVKQKVGFKPGTFRSAVKCFNYLATVSLTSIISQGSGDVYYLFLKHQNSVLNRLIATPSGVQETVDTTSGLTANARWV